jgi:hypothetical protein
MIPLKPSIVNSALKMETEVFSEKLASTNQSTRPVNPEDLYRRHRGGYLNLMNSALCPQGVFMDFVCFSE